MLVVRTIGSWEQVGLGVTLDYGNDVQRGMSFDALQAVSVSARFLS